MRTDRALVLGGADCVWDDVLALEKLYGRRWDGIVVAANDVGAHWPRDLHHWVSLHPGKFEQWRALRKKHELSCDGIVTWAAQRAASRYRDPKWADRYIIPWTGGSSGMAALQVALDELNCKMAILCGVPMTRTPHFTESTERFHINWLSADAHFKMWRRIPSDKLARGRSMSGRTRDLLGAPTAEELRNL